MASAGQRPIGRRQCTSPGATGRSPPVGLEGARKRPADAPRGRIYSLQVSWLDAMRELGARARGGLAATRKSTAPPRPSRMSEESRMLGARAQFVKQAAQPGKANFDVI